MDGAWLVTCSPGRGLIVDLWGRQERPKLASLPTVTKVSQSRGLPARAPGVLTMLAFRCGLQESAHRQRGKASRDEASRGEW